MIHHRNRPIAVNINLAVLVHQVTKDIKVIADIKEVSIIVIGGHGLEVSIINIDLKSVKQWNHRDHLISNKIAICSNSSSKAAYMRIIVN